MPSLLPVLQPYKEGTLLRVKAVPKAAKNELREVFQDGDAYRLKITVTSTPEKGNANVHIIELLSKILGLPKSLITILSGSTNPRKSFYILASHSTLKNRIESLSGEALS